MNSLTTQTAEIPAMTEEQIAKVFEFEKLIADMPPAAIETHHVIHAGMYSRTVYIPKGTAATGMVIKVPSMFTVCGDCTVYLGDSSIDIKGYNVFPAAANRKQACLAHGDTVITMTFPTNARTVEEAELEAIDNPDALISHNGGSNHVLITEA